MQMPLAEAASSVVLALPSQGLGLGILDSYVADKSLDPVGIAECYLLALCFVRQLLDARAARRCEVETLHVF